MPAAAPRVLLVEDDDAVRGFLGRALERGGWESTGVRTGEEAFEIVHADSSIGAVLIDGLLPDMHGVRVAHRLLDDPAAKRIGIGFISGAIREHQPAESGIAALSKPVRLPDLLATVQALLDWHEYGTDDTDTRRSVVKRFEQGFLVGP
ncbi:MAG: response regulator [Candidatus Dormibacteraeota bacterium]|nr:response regulator [Candidatus Dormibacteraeota bacterium]MBV9524388.1 response regulator [Candidatus Dormibacteraeota bacterium]